MIKYLTIKVSTAGLVLSVPFVRLTLFHFRKNWMLSTEEVDQNWDYC